MVIVEVSIVKEEAKEKKTEKKDKKETASASASTKEEKQDYSKMTVAELKEIAKEKGIEGYTSMKKSRISCCFRKINILMN